MGWITEEAQGTRLLWDVLDAMGVPAFALNNDLSIIDINSSVTVRLSFTMEDLSGRDIFDAISVSSRFPEDLFSNNTLSVEGLCLRKDRERFPSRITSIRHAGGFIVTVEDRSDEIKLSTRAALRSREINFYNALPKILSRSSDLKETMKAVIDTLLGIMNIDAAWLYLADESGAMSLCCFSGAEERTFGEGKNPYDYFIGRVLSSGRALLVKNASFDPRINCEDAPDTVFESIAGVPLTVKTLGDSKGKTIGVLGVADMKESRFSAFDMQFLSVVGNQLGVSVENYRLIAKLKEKMKQIELTNEIGSVVNSSLSIGHIFRIVVSEIKRMIDFDRASITLLDESKNTMQIFALDTNLKTRLKKGTRAPLDGTSASWVTINQKPWINGDLEKEIAFGLDSVLLNEGIRSTISVPLYKDRPLGSLNFDSIHPEKYSEGDLEVLMPVAKHLSIALENALLFEEISKEKREWEKTFDSITDMVWIEDLRGNVMRANIAVLEKTLMSETSLTRKTSAEIFRALNIQHTETHIYKTAKEKKVQYRELKGATGSIYNFWTYPLLDSEGDVYGIVCSLKDVTKDKRLEQQLLRADKLASLGTLVAGIAHEINNPLGIIAGYSDALMDRSRDPALTSLKAFEDFPGYLETINNEIFRCKDILKSLLDFARPSSGTCREIDINEIIKEVILLIKHKAQKKNQTIELNLNRDIPKTMGEAGALRQLFMNIIMNAFSFMDTDGKIFIGTAYETDSYENDIIHVSIKDNGRGIGKEIINRIFDPFFTTKPVGEGTGLGLAICHRIVSEHEGTIDVQSEPGKGTTFNIRLPVRQAEPS
jgi:two-component system NtrC family sensor kinase